MQALGEGGERWMAVSSGDRQALGKVASAGDWQALDAPTRIGGDWQALGKVASAGDWALGGDKPWGEVPVLDGCAYVA